MRRTTIGTVVLGLGALATLTGSAVSPRAATIQAHDRPLAMAIQAKPRAFSGDATFYGGGAGSCGGRHSAEELIAALPASIYDGPKGSQGKGANCGRKIRVSRADKSVVVTVVDRCAGCKYGDIDLSRAAFAQLASLGEGRINVTWEFIA